MGNIQKKLMVRSEGGRRSRRARTPVPRADQQAGQPETATASISDNHDPEQRRAADSPGDLKSRGNELFRGGQFAEAAAQYSAAIAQLEPTGSENADELSILYSNRAACYLKEGNCRGCIQDCDRALELHPFSVKPLLRRAMAYETLEQYRSAYVDYVTVLKIDCRIQLASDSVNRITRILTELDGPKWRERLPPIPAVPVSESLRVWHPAAETPDQDPCPNSCTPSITDEKMFQALKEEGNQLVKDKNYKDAISKYNECLKINSKACAIYTNRALCYLKLGQFEEAKLDCDKALQIDSKNVKASYRLELAQKGLENCQERVADPSQVVLLSPDSSEAARHLDTKNDTAPPSRERERRRIEIQEVDDSSDEEPERPTEASAVEDRWSAEQAGKIEVCKPRNAYEFGQVLTTISARKDEEACAQLLALTASQDLPVLLSNKLEGDMFLLIMQSLKSHLVAKDPSLVYKHLLYLSKAERFEMMLALTSKDQKEQMAQLFDGLSDAQADCLTAEDIQALRRQYVL